MKRVHMIIIAIILVVGGVIEWRLKESRLIMIQASQPEEVVYARTDDGFIDAGVMFSTAQKSKKQTAIIWVHGWGVNFYSPTYVNIGRALSDRGFTTLVVNTRMHDIGNVLGYRFDKRIRGGGYWGVASDEVRDIAAWVDFAEQQGFDEVVLVGHSAGWAAVKRYQAERQDKRVVAIVSASGSLYTNTSPLDSAQLAQAQRIMKDGQSEDLIKDPKRSFPSYISAATIVDIANTPAEYRDFFGFQYATPGIQKIDCPILAFFGTNGDVGDEAELEAVKAAVKKQPQLKCTVTTALISDADHMYAGQEEQVADTLVTWIEDNAKTRSKK